jgi:S1-C subfamily serine protease
MVSASTKESLRRSAVVIAVEEVSPAVVNISTVVQERVGPIFPFSRDDFFRDFFPDFFTREYTRTSLGSGVIIDGGKGYIITNHHVVARATEIKVITADQKDYKGRVLGSDPRSDLAVLQIDVRRKLPEIRMGNSDDMMIGETVIAIGNPFGLSHTVTTGVVSALNRSVRTEERIYRHFIQTDASINPGNSGGPLLNIEGDLIGINTAIYQKAQGIGFAIPINKAKRIVRELIREGRVRFPWLGVELQELTEELRGHFNLAEEGRGVLINDVTDGSPALKAGLKRGDIILSRHSHIIILRLPRCLG